MGLTQSLVWLKSPVMAMAGFSVRGTKPLLVSVTVLVAEGVLMVWSGKLSVAPLRSAVGTPAVPDTGTICGLPGALSAIASEAVRVPAAVGANFTVMVQLALTARVPPQVEVSVKSPELAPVKVKGVRPVKFRTAVPLLVTVTFLPVAEVVPTACRAKAGSVVGETEAPGMPTTPVPLRSMARDSGTVSEMVRMADSAAVTDGVNLTSTVQVAL